MSLILSARLQFRKFQMADTEEVFSCITPAITRYLTWDPPSWDEYLALCEAGERAPDPNTYSFVIRRRDGNECLGVAALEHADRPAPEIGLWLKESAHGQGYGREVVEALIVWASQALGRKGFIYPVAEQNTASRRIAEGLRGEVIGTLDRPKYRAVVYQIPAKS